MRLLSNNEIGAASILPLHAADESHKQSDFYEPETAPS